jgi:uncharacterized protein YhfF
MKSVYFSNPAKKLLQIVLALAIVGFSLGINDVTTVYAVPPDNNLFANRTVIASLPYNPSILDTTQADAETDDPTLTSATGGVGDCEGISLRQTAASVWYEYVGSNEPVFLDTTGSYTLIDDPGNPGNYEYDTVIAVFTSTEASPALTDLDLVVCNDIPNDATNLAKLSFYGVSGITYYIMVAQYNGQADVVYTYPGYNGGFLDFSMTTGLTISGNAGGMGGAKVSFQGGATIANSNGDYILAIPSGFTGTVTPSVSGYLFGPAAKSYTNVTTNKSGENYNLYFVPPGDFNGDGKTDVAVFRPSDNTWRVSGQGTTAFGQGSDIPVPADYNGDGKDDFAVFRPSNNTWYINGQGSYVYGTTGDIPVVADYNGDGKADIAVFRPSNSTWYVRGQGSFVYGTVGDIPVVADYNGDGKADIAVFRPTNSTWYLYGIGPRVYGTVGDIPVVADYTGDGLADIAVFRPTNSTWYVYGVGPSVYGTVGDIPVIGDYNGDGKADITVFRPSNSTWYKYGVGPSVYGTIGDIPV